MRKDGIYKKNCEKQKEKGTEERGWECYLSPSQHLSKQQVSQTKHCPEAEAEDNGPK